MVHAQSCERPVGAALSLSPLQAVMNWFEKHVANRNRQAALRALLAMDEARLEDIGICRQDIFDAMNSNKSLHNRRAERARDAIRNN